VSGKQQPRIRTHPGNGRTYGDLAADFGTRYHLTPDPWQRLVLDDWLAERNGTWAATTCALSAPRQNGKNVAVELREIFGMVGNGERILHTAHQVRTAQAHFQRLKYFFGERANDPNAIFPELNKRVKRVRSANGQEAIELYNGGMIGISARSAQAGRGLSYDVLICDEAQDMSDDELEAISPVISAAPLGNRQTIFTGTPPGPRSNGEAFARIRAEGIGGHSVRLSYLEWSAQDGCDLDDAAQWATANPGLGIRINLDTIADERSRFSDEGFARERLGMWSSAAAAGHVISASLWAAQADQQSFADAHLALAVDVSPDRSVASVAVAGERPDGLWHCELAEQRAGVSWIPAYLAKLANSNPVRAIVIDGASQAHSLLDDLGRVGIRPTMTGPRDMASACGQFYDGVTEGWLHHIDQPQLNYALSVARKRSMLNGDAWGWNRKSADSDITPLVAATLAVWGARTTAVTKPIRKSNGERRVVVI
jgi:phage terminase large subunit-like protein